MLGAGGHVPLSTLLDVCAVQMLTRIVNGNVYEKRMKIQTFAEAKRNIGGELLVYQEMVCPNLL